MPSRPDPMYGATDKHILTHMDKKKMRRDGAEFKNERSGGRSDNRSGRDFNQRGKSSFGPRNNSEKSDSRRQGSSQGRSDRPSRNADRFDKPYNERKRDRFASPRHSDGESSGQQRKSFDNQRDNQRPYRGSNNRQEESNRTYRGKGSQRPYRGKSNRNEGAERSYGNKASYNKPVEKKASKQRSVELLFHTHADDGLVRLNKFLSHAGICSRREADNLIQSGCVSVNGQVVKEMGFLVKPDDVVTYCGRELKGEINRYFLLNKPKGFITTLDDPQDRRTVMMLMDGACSERIYPVGRLDRNTTGLLLFTNDGNMAKKLTHPSSKVYKIYHVELDKPVSREAMNSMLEGLDLEDGIIRVDDVQYVEGTSDRRSVGVALHSGKNRIVRRIFEHLGYEVVKLDRVVFAGLTKKDLPRGRFRELTEKEVGYLKML